jgi:hypothetical protein
LADEAGRCEPFFAQNYFQVRPRTTYNSRRKRIEVKISGFPPLPGALAMQIILVVAGSRGIAI